MMSVLKEEQAVGLSTFYTSLDGIGGKLRVFPEDFIVTELFSYPPRHDEGIFTIATIQSRNWETNHLIRTLSKQLHISRKRIQFAGTKDKRSISTQLFSFYDVSPEDISQLKLKDVIISDVYRSNEKLYLGALKGNHFDIIIRDVTNTYTKIDIDILLTPLQQINGFPNFFGIQRFGIIRPITHLVGKKLVQGDIKGAVLIYLCAIDDHENKTITTERNYLTKTRDFAHGFHHFPPSLSYEKAMCNHLQNHPDDFYGALKQLPKNLITLFVNAYQSYLFNQMLSLRIKNDLPINQAVNGDVIIEMDQGQMTDHYFPVTTGNVDKVNHQINRGKAVVSSVLVGYETRFSKGEMGDIEHTIFDAEQIDQRDFIIRDLAIASSKGSRRGLHASISNLSYQVERDSEDTSKHQVHIQFDLTKGCYATSFLRELMKADDVRNY
jgi:tRNA pseudouridine13 synthase